MLQHDGHDIGGGPAMAHHVHAEGVDFALLVEQRDVDAFSRGAGVLQRQPLVIAHLGVALGEAVEAGGGRSHLADDIGAPNPGEQAPIAAALVVVGEEHLALGYDAGSRGGDLGGDTLTRLGGIAIDVEDCLRERGDRHGGLRGAAIGILQLDGHAGRGVGALVQVGDDEVLLELAADVALGKQPVRGERLHANHIGPARHDARVAAVEVGEVGGALHRHRLVRGHHHRHMRG